ncbi:MAG TPA: MBL fold metallo-hydrolase [Steroidobacteraceae bacterium]
MTIRWENAMRAAILLSAVLGLGVAASARAEVPFVSVTPAVRSFNLGALHLSVLHDAQIIVPNDGKTFGIGIHPREVGAVLRQAGAPADRIPLSVNVLMLHVGPRLVLIDTGLSPGNHGDVLGALRSAGETPDAVTDVLITHPHLDHVGGLIDAAGRPAFPRATVHMASAAWAWMQKNAAPEVVRAVAGKVRTFEPGARILPGIKSVSLPGHTPGHVGYLIVSGHDRLLDIGDIAHSSIVSLARPRWAIQFDNDEALGSQTRLKTLTMLSKNGEWVYSPHFPFPGVGHIVARGQGFAWKPGLP